MQVWKFCMYENMLVREYASVKLCKCECMQLWGYTSVKAYKCESMQVYVSQCACVSTVLCMCQQSARDWWRSALLDAKLTGHVHLSIRPSVPCYFRTTENSYFLCCDEDGIRRGPRESLGPIRNDMKTYRDMSHHMTVVQMTQVSYSGPPCLHHCWLGGLTWHH